MTRLEVASVTDGTTAAPVELNLVSARLAQGVRLDDSAPFAAVLTPSIRVARGRKGEHLVFFFHPQRAETRDLCAELHGLIAQVYWSTAGSVTAALRRAVSAASRHLFEHNLNSDPSDRCYGGLSCAVLRHKDVFLVQTGPVWACILRGEKLTFFPPGEGVGHLGIGPVTPVRLDHVSTSPGDTLLMASPSLAQAAEREGLLKVLSDERVTGIMPGLGDLARRADFAALAVRWERTLAGEVVRTGRSPEAAPVGSPVPVGESRRGPRAAERRIEQGPKVTAMRPAVPGHDSDHRRRLEASSTAIKAFAVRLRRKLVGGLRWASGGSGHLWHGVAAVGSGMAALGKWLIGAVGTTIRGTLPGSQRPRARSINRRPPPQENRTISLVVAIAIPILVVGVAVFAYLQLATQSRFESIIQEAESEIAQAWAVGVNSREARPHWEEALQQIERAIVLQPDDPHSQALRRQARDALDDIDGVARLTLTELADFGSSNRERRLVLSGQAVFVLDSKDGWSAQVALDGADDGSEGREAVVLVGRGQHVEGRGVDRLVDCVWVAQEGGRQSSALFVLEAGGGVISYDPAWETEDGAPQLTRVQLRPPLPTRAMAAGSYRGQFYVLDAAAANGGQVWRYRPQGNVYPEPPEPYFETVPERGLETAVDMAIDGHIYVLYDDGTVEKFLGGQPVPFEIRAVPEGLGQAGGFAVDPRGSGLVYILDQDNDRIVELNPDGSFKAQLVADEGFVALEAVAVSEAAGRIYVLDGGRLYVASLP